MLQIHIHVRNQMNSRTGHIHYLCNMDFEHTLWGKVLVDNDVAAVIFHHVLKIVRNETHTKKKWQLLTCDIRISNNFHIHSSAHVLSGVAKKVIFSLILLGLSIILQYLYLWGVLLQRPRDFLVLLRSIAQIWSQKVSSLPLVRPLDWRLPTTGPGRNETSSLSNTFYNAPALLFIPTLLFHAWICCCNLK